MRDCRLCVVILPRGQPLQRYALPRIEHLETKMLGGNFMYLIQYAIRGQWIFDIALSRSPILGHTNLSAEGRKHG